LWGGISVQTFKNQQSISHFPSISVCGTKLIDRIMGTRWTRSRSLLLPQLVGVGREGRKSPDVTFSRKTGAAEKVSAAPNSNRHFPACFHCNAAAQRVVSV
jgi:hypothetical protein